MAYDVKATEQYIREAAAARGINPDIAVRVARSEGLANGVYQSNLSKGGSREPSYGPFQLLVGGQGTNYPAGMGNDFIARTGLDPRDPSTVPQQVDFALDNAAKNGWGAWYGAKKVGVDRFDGIGGQPSGRAPTTQIATVGGGDAMVYGGAQDDTLGVEPIAPPTNPGGLGGLGGFQGFVNNPEFGDTLQAIGLSLMSSPSNNPFAGVGENLANRQNLRARQEDRQEARAERQQDRQAIEMLLRSRGLSAEEARAYSANTSAANTVLAEQQERAEENKTRTWLKSAYPDLADQVDAGLPITEGVRIAGERRKAELGGEMTADMRNYRLAQDDPNFASFIGAGSKAAGFRNATPEEAASYGAAAGQFGPDNRFYPINAPSGMSVESDGKGGIRVVQGAVGGKGGAFTEGQSKDNVYSVRARGSLPTLDTYADNLADFGQKVVEADPTGVIRGSVQTPEYQVARTAADEFLQAILRKDTGAAITAQEQELYGRTYLPQPGDSTEVRAYKTKARQRAIAAVEAGMSPAQMVAQERGIAASGGSAPSPVPGSDVGTNNTADPLGLR